jgi:hypothetical protein
VKRAALFLLVACTHNGTPGPPGRPQQQPPPLDPLVVAQRLSDETHALLRTEGELLWKRWTTGAGPLPASAMAEHPQLAQRESAKIVAAAAARAPSRALELLAHQLAAYSVSHDAGAEIEALEHARAQLIFAAPAAGAGAKPKGTAEGDGSAGARAKAAGRSMGDERADRGERDLDRLLTEESSGQKRLALAQAEAKAAQSLAPLALARDAAVEKAIAALGLGSWASLEERGHGLPVAEIASLAEKTLAATEAVTAKAVAGASVRNLGMTADRLRRADLPRLVRTALADAEFRAGRAWPVAMEVFTAIDAEPPPGLQLDAEPSPSKGARPLALLVDPPVDVRLSLRPTGGFEEQRATLHEGARAVGGALAHPERWELAQLGDGSAAEGAAQLFEELAGEPLFLREQTALRGEPLDDLVHTQAARRLLGARRAAALVLFEVRRREEAQTAEAQAALYRGLLQRATLARFSEEDGGRWALEADIWLRGATALEGAVLAAQIDRALGPQWWKAKPSGAALRKVWAGGRSMTALEGARALGLTALDPAALAAVAEERLSYQAPDPAPKAPKPDYKYMQGDKRRRKRHKKR